MSQYHALLGNTSSIGANIIYTPDESNIKPGEDFVVYDKFEGKYKALRAHSYEEMSFDTERYETNWDVIIGHKNGITHAVAKDDAYNQTDTVQDDTAAAPCYYRIEIDNTQDGGFHYNLYSHDGQEGDVSWSANDTMQSILNKISVPSYSGKAVLNDGTGIGIYLGGYSSNTCQITDITGTVTVVDMSQFATEDDYLETEYKGSEPYIIRPTADGVLANKQRFDGNGSAEIKTLYGNSIVWNQLVDTSQWFNTVTAGLTVTTNDNKISVEGTTTYGFNYTVSNFKGIQGHKILLYPTNNDSIGVNKNILDRQNNIFLGFWSLPTIISIEQPSNDIIVYFNVQRAGIECKVDNLGLTIFDLTQMFGEGNEPTIEQFKQWFPNDYYEYNAGEIINVNIDGLKTVGFNAYNNGTANVIANNQYQITGAYTSAKYSDDTDVVIEGGLFTPTKNDTIAIAGGGADTCVHLTWSGYRNGDYEPYQEHNINITVKEIKDANGNLLFPDGLCSIGNVKDEVTSDKAIKRVDKYTFTGDEGWSTWGTNDNGYITLYSYNIPNNIKEGRNRLLFKENWEYHLYGIYGDKNSINTNSYGPANFYWQFAVHTSIADSTTAFKQYLKNRYDNGDPLTVYYELETPIEVNFKDVQQSFGDKLNLTYTYDPYGTEEFLYDSEDIKVPASTINNYESHMYASAPYTEKNQTINDSFKNWRGVSAQTILGSSKIPVGPNSSCLCNTNMNYTYRSGVNFSGFKSWASTSGTTTFTTDGVNGTANNSAGVVMSQSTFNSNVNNTFDESTPNGKMYDYYNKLLNSEGNEFDYLHNQYVERYGTMSTLYDAYLMSHMVNTDNPSSGITYTAMNMGKQLTEAKGRVMAVDYNYNYVPAYPPEYNALHYGVSNKGSMFSKGKYSHPEVYDLGLMFRDDIMQKCNSNWAKIKGIKYTALANNTYRGSCAESGSGSTWKFYGVYRCIYGNLRCYGYFRSRPVLAFETF